MRDKYYEMIILPTNIFKYEFGYLQINLPY